MIKLHRLVTEYQLTYPNVQLLEADDMGGVPKLFEENTMAFYCDKKLYLVPDYRVVHCELHRGRLRPPKEGLKIKKLTLNYEITHQNVTVIPESSYSKYNVPTIFRDRNQLAFMTKEGIWVTSDIQVILAQVE